MSCAATQISRGYQAGVAFVNSDDEDDCASDSDIERRKQAKKTAELDKKYLEAERTWMARERKREARHLIQPPELRYTLLAEFTKLQPRIPNDEAC